MGSPSNTAYHVCCVFNQISCHKGINKSFSNIDLSAVLILLVLSMIQNSIIFKL